MDNLLNTILANTYTLQSLRSRLHFLKEYLSAKFYGQLRFDQGQQQLSFSPKDLDWLQSLGDAVSQFNADNLAVKIESLEKEAQRQDHLTIYFAVDLPDEKIIEIARYIRGNFKQQLLLDVKLDPSLIAGCALVSRGVYQDYSIRKKLEDQKLKIIEQFKLFLK